MDHLVVVDVGDPSINPGLWHLLDVVKWVPLAFLEQLGVVQKYNLVQLAVLLCQLFEVLPGVGEDLAEGLGSVVDLQFVIHHKGLVV